MAAAESSSSVVRAEALTYTLCLSSIELILKEGQKLAIFLCSLGERFLYGSQGGEEYLFPNDSVSVLQAAHSAGIHK